MQTSQGLRTVAIFEATKGALVLLAGLGLFALIHTDLQSAAERLVAHTHLNPASRYPRIFLDLTHDMTASRLWMLAAAAGAYSMVRFIEAYGLWHARAWGEWFAALSGSVYIPFELAELLHRPDWLAAIALLLNAGIVGFMFHSLRRDAANRKYRH